MKSLLIDDKNSEWRDAVYYHYYEFPNEHMVKKHYGVRTDRYKLIHFYDDIDVWELYDLEKDPSEMNNIFGNLDYAEIQKKMEVRLTELQKEYDDNSMNQLKKQ